MNNFTFLNFVLLQLYTNKSKHFSIFIISTILIMVLSSFLFITNSISKDMKTVVDNQADFILQGIVAGKVVDTPLELVDEIISINGVTQASQRVYGKHFYEPAEHYFTIVGIDLYDKQIVSNLKSFVKNIDIDKFLSKQNMLIGSGVKKFLNEYAYFDYYNFRPPDKSFEKVYIYDMFENETDIVSSDMIIMDINLAKKILGIDEDYSTDILFNVPNIDERETVKNKIRARHFDIRIIAKEDLLRGYDGFLNYRSSVFMILYLIVILTFILIIYQRYSYINSVDKKEIGVLRSLGWSINRVIRLKIVENLIIFIGSYILGVNLAYIFVFIFDAPLLSSVFLGFSNLSNNTQFTAVVDISSLSLIFLFFIVPIIAAILIPVWKISIIEPYEAMR
ncbi:MAG: FtsX-like permease family protein [Campylobacterota bacterium]|nr:FtsX-like permease family protein [Campylobacterota bacterium]